jgi:hypothetical protein
MVYHFYIYLLVYKFFVSRPPACFQAVPVLPYSLLQFCWRENIRDNKKDSVLLVWGKDSYTEKFLVFFPGTCVLQLTLVHLCQTFSLLPGPFPIVASASLRLLYSLLNREPINHIQVLGCLAFPYVSRVCSPFSVWTISNNITHLFWVYNQHMRKNMWFLAFWTWLTSLKMMFSRF